MDALKVALHARAGLAGVQVTTAPAGSETRSESIQMGDAGQSEVWAVIGTRRRDEDFTIDAAIWKVQPGAGDAVATTARLRAYALLAEVEAALRESPRLGLAGVEQMAVSNADLEQGVNPDGRWAQLTFQVRVTARLSFVP